MAVPSFKFLFGFSIVLIILWLIFMFASRLVALILSKVVGASVAFRVGGWKSLKDVVIKFRKGAIESISVGEIKLSLRQSLVKLGVGIISRDPKLQILICDLKVTMRPSVKGVPKSSKPRSSRPKGKGKLMVVANIARYLSVSITDLVLKTPKATIEVKDLSIDISKSGGEAANLVFRLQILPISVHLGEPRVSCEQSSNLKSEGCISAVDSSLATTDKSSAPFICEEFSVSSEFGPDREAGISVKNIDIAFGEVNLNLNEELFSKSKKETDSSFPSDKTVESTADSQPTVKPQKKQPLASLSKYTSVFPEKVSFCLPKLNVMFVHREHELVVENNIVGFQFKIIKSPCLEDSGETARLDLQMEFSEIHLLREADTSLLEILKVDVVTFVYIPIQPASPIRVEVDLKLGGTRCNIIISRLKPWLRLHSSKKKKMVLKKEKPSEKPKSSESKAITWTCTVSAPEMTIVLYSTSGSPLYHGCSQSSHVFANNRSNMGVAVHMELGELNLHLADEYQERLKESLTVESNSGSLIHIAKISLDWGKKDIQPSEEEGLRSKLVLSVDVTGMGFYFTFKRIESLVSTAMILQSLLKQFSGSRKKTTQSQGDRSTKSSGKGTKLLKLRLEKCSITVCGDIDLENMTVADPKRVYYGSQGGQVVMTVNPDGTPRYANVMSTMSDECKRVNYSIALDIFHLSLCVNKEKQSTQVEVERVRSIYQEHLEEHGKDTKLTFFDIQNAKFVRRSGGLKEISVCSLFSATDISVGWEPDVQLSLVELGLQLKLLVHNKKVQGDNNVSTEDASNTKDSEQKTETISESGQPEKQKKKESIFAVDVEMLRVYAQAGDGVDAVVQVQSIFSENARIGVLLEGLLLSFNGSRVLKSSRMQISRIPNVSTGTCDMKVPVTTWDWVIQGLDIHICLPYRLQLRAIDDSVEDMLRALKLITAAKTSVIFPMKKESSKVKKPSSTKVGSLKFCIRKLTADIEEEPLQGWLDEHYKLIRNEAYEVAVRLKFLDDLISKANQVPKTAETIDSPQERKTCYNGIEVDPQNPSDVLRMRDEIHRQSFQSYYRACQNILPSEGSGSCTEGLQSGFKFSTARTFLMSVTATDLDVSLTKIDGGDDGMIDVLRRLDPVCLQENIPFSRLYGRNILLNAGSLAVLLRDYPFPLFAATSGKCEGCLVMAQQATCFQPQIYQDVYVGKWRKVQMLRSASGTTPAMKTYSNLPIHFKKAELSFGVGYEPIFADISYAFTVALRRANLSVCNPGPLIQPPKKEKSLPWWDDMRYYIHGNITLYFSETRWNILGSADPYEKLEKLQVLTGQMEVQQSDGRIFLSCQEFRILTSSLESMAITRGLKLPQGISGPFLETPVFTLEVNMIWGCDSDAPLNHYLHAFPVEGKSRDIVFDPFRSTSLSLQWSFTFRPPLPSSEKQLFDNIDKTNCSTKLSFGAHDLAWMSKFGTLNYLPPTKLRTFSRWARFGVPRIIRSGNLPMDKVITEFMLRVDITTPEIRHVPLDDDDPAKGLTFSMAKLKFEIGLSRGKPKYTFECRRDNLDLFYQGLDLHMLKAFTNKENCSSVAKAVQMTRKNSQSASTDKVPTEKGNSTSSSTEKHRDDGFFVTADYFTIRRQSPKADPARLLAWQEAGKRNVEMLSVKTEFENENESDERARSDPSDDDGYNVVVADNCQRVFVYGLKLLWTIENRGAITSFAGGLTKALQPSKPSPSRQYTQRKLLEEKLLAENQPNDKAQVCEDEEISKAPNNDDTVASSTSQPEALELQPATLQSVKTENISSTDKGENVSSPAPGKDEKLDDKEDEGTRLFMVNVIGPQFNLHSEEANGRFLLAAATGRILARSFHSIVQVGHHMIEQALAAGNVQISECEPEMTWKRMELSVMLEHVQAHVAPTDVDPGAGLQWLPKILRSSPKVKRTGALLERVFMPCNMYFRYTRHKGGTPELKVKPLKELTFTSENITATMTSRQFQVMVDVLTNLLFARLPKPRNSSPSFPSEDGEDVEEEADEVVPDGVEEVELAKINLEVKEREQRLLRNDIRKLSLYCDGSDQNPEKDGEMWMVSGGKSLLVQGLKRELVNAQKSRKTAYASLRVALQDAAQARLMEKEKNKSPSYAMRISLKIDKVVWSMLVDGKPFAETELNDMFYDFDRDYKDIGIAQFTTKNFVIRNCLANAKSDTLLSAWNPPPDWGKLVMVRVHAKQGAPRDGNSLLEMLQVDIYPLKIHLTEAMYRMMWGYLFSEEDQDSQRRQEAWKISTAAGSRRVKKGEVSTSKELEMFSKLGFSLGGQASASAESSQASKSQNPKSTAGSSSGSELRRTSSFDRSWEETVAESVATELVLQSITKSGPLGSGEQPDESANKLKDPKAPKTAGRSSEEKKVIKPQDEKRARPRKLMEFHNIKISQVELLVTYEGSRFVVNDLKLLMDTFHRVEFTGTWRRLFSRVKKHIIWGVLKSVTGMQGKKFKDKAHTQKEHPNLLVPDTDFNLSDNEGALVLKSDQNPVTWLKRPADGAGDGFVTSIRGLFNNQRRKAKAFVLRTMRGEADGDFPGDWSDTEAEFSPFARQLTITKAKKLIRRHTKKFQARQKDSSPQQRDESLPLSPREAIVYDESDSSSGSSFGDFTEQEQLQLEQMKEELMAAGATNEREA
ncbi:Protein SABRE, partial [Cucurbita argyrosperma subsp. sororia]